MPGTSTIGSTNITLLDSRIYANMCVGRFYIDLSPSIYIGNGANNVLGANVQIKNPLGVIVKPYGTNYEIAPALSGGMDAIIPYNIPTQAGNFQYGNYTVDVQLFDAGGNSWVVSKPVSLCEPDQFNKTRNYGTLSAKLLGNCKDGKLAVIVNNVPTYKGKISEGQTNDFLLEYPTSSGLSPLSASVTNFSVVLFEGIYKLSGTVCATYNLGDNIYVQVLYKLKLEKNQKCMIDLCCVYQQLASIDDQLTTECSPEKQNEIANRVIDALRLIKSAELAADCGEDPSRFISQLEDLLGCSCTCACNDGTPIIDQSPSRDVVITGCNVEKTSTGLTDTYVINNHEYKTTIVDNGGALIIAAASENGCIRTQEITFNIDVVYFQLKGIANSSLAEANFWASVVRKSLIGLDASCIGLTPRQFAVIDLRGIFAAIFNQFCLCCGCTAGIDNLEVQVRGIDDIFTWTESGSIDSVDIYINNVFQANVLAGVRTYRYRGNPAQDNQINFRFIPKCKNGSGGTPIEGQSGFVGRAVYVAPPSVFSKHLVGPCPYDLTTNVDSLPFGIGAEWHINNNTDEGSLVPDPTQAIQSSYYVFAKDPNGFYSTGVQVTLVCDTSGSCSAPQNLTVVPSFGGNLIQFQSAAYTPPLNSYTVKRRVKSDADIAGNYTTIGAPVWNASANRWQIPDPSAVSNVLYVYRAISNCGATQQYVDFDFASIPCPVITLKARVTDIDYSFSNAAGTNNIDKYEITVYEADGITPVHKDTHVPAFPSPITGTFSYLNPASNYKIGLKVYIGAYVKDCGSLNTATLSNESTLTLDYIAGRWIVTLTSPVPVDFTVGVAKANGGNNSDCSAPTESDELDVIGIPQYELFGEKQTNGITYHSNYYSIEDHLTVSGVGVVVNGETFIKSGVALTVIINRLTCGYYPA